MQDFVHQPYGSRDKDWALEPAASHLKFVSADSSKRHQACAVAMLTRPGLGDCWPKLRRGAGRDLTVLN